MKAVLCLVKSPDSGVDGKLGDPSVDVNTCQNYRATIMATTIFHGGGNSGFQAGVINGNIGNVTIGKQRIKI